MNDVFLLPRYLRLSDTRPTSNSTKDKRLNLCQDCWVLNVLAYLYTQP